MIRRTIMMASLFLLILCYHNVYAVSSIVGDWVGGINSAKWRPVNCHFVSGARGFSGTLDLPYQNQSGLVLTKIVVTDGHLHMEWESDSRLGVFEGVIARDFISGQFTQAGTTAPFGLVRVSKINPTLLEDYSGSYQIGRNRFIDIGPIGDAIKFIDSQTRDTRYLYPSSETSFFSGPSIRIPYPVELRINFFRNRQGAVSGLMWQEKGGRPLRARKLPITKEEVSYHYGDATVTAALLLPSKKGPLPALIDVGEGYFLGPDNGPDQYFYVRQGLAMMTPIRRVVNGADSNYLKSSFEDRAREILAAVAALKQRADI